MSRIRCRSWPGHEVMFCVEEQEVEGLALESELSVSTGHEGMLCR